MVLLEDEDPLDFLDTVEQTSEERLDTAKQRINDIADKIKASSSEIFIPATTSSTDKAHADPDTQRQQLEELSKVTSSMHCFALRYLEIFASCALNLMMSASSEKLI